MKTLQELLDDLDAMVDNGTAPKHEVRSLIAFITREVLAFEDIHARTVADHTQLVQTNSQLQAFVSEMKSEFEGKILKMKERDKKEMSDWLKSKTEAYRKMIKDHELEY